MSSWLLFLSEMSDIKFLGLLRVFMALMSIVIKDFYGMNWLVCKLVGLTLVHWGDFNVSRFLSERSSETLFCPVMEEFSYFIFEQGLMDVPLVSGLFAWSSNRNPPSWFGIDIFLVSPNWEVKFPNLI